MSSFAHYDVLHSIECLQLLGNGGDSEGLFRAAMGDSPSLNFAPTYKDSYIQSIFEQFSSFAYVTLLQVLGCTSDNYHMQWMR